MSSQESSQEWQSYLQPDQVFYPSKALQESSFVSSREDYDALWQESIRDPEAFWAEQARVCLTWFKPWDRVFTADSEHHYRWFDGAKLNASFNCLDRHLADKGDQRAFVWEGEDGRAVTWTYRQLHHRVCCAASALRSMGVTKGDVVVIYLPMIPELILSVLACARLGATHNVIFGGFASESIAARIHDCKAQVVITADGGFRRGSIVPLKNLMDQALSQCPEVTHTLVVQRTGQTVFMDQARDHWWHGLVPAHLEPHEVIPAVPVDGEHPLFLLYTSGSTGKPKGVVHTTAGYLLQTHLTSRYVFNLSDKDLFWCTADVGWITGHNYVIYGPLSNGSCVFMYEGVPDFPDWGTYWRLIERYQVNKFYTAPTAIRNFMRQGSSWPTSYDLSSLELLGSVGEPINPAAWLWYHQHIGGKRCPIVDTWWQTETGAIMISALPGAIATKPGSATVPFFGIEPLVVDQTGQEVPRGQGGYLVIKHPWPSMMRTILGDHPRFVKTYWDVIPGVYFTGDGARQDADGDFWIMGRIDDVINVSGHRLSTMEVESALVSHPAVSEAAVVGCPDDITGESVYGFVTLKQNHGLTDEATLILSLEQQVDIKISKIARPKHIQVLATLPKTRSGKIMRRVLRALAQGKPLTEDLSTLEDSSFMEQLRRLQEDSAPPVGAV